MNTVLVWVLVTLGGYGGNTVTYSPYIADRKSCEFLQDSLPNSNILTSRCIQIRVVK